MSSELEAEQKRQIEKCEQFCFDYTKFDKDMRSGDIITTVLKAHLYLEHVLIQTLLDACPNPEAIELRRMNFPAKLDLCIALGLLPDLWSKPVRTINDMRNTVAHRLEFQFSDSERLKLYNLLPEFLREECLVNAGKKRGAEKALEWWQIFVVIVVWLEIARQKVAAGRVRQEFAGRSLREVLDKSKAATT
ncbi:hypothetical protein [Afipia sp. DC4300-2b1]|uniref:hypothetical protein n=1 Tax=Afipia sp. DC4300-2b1 TaxID=2804672 RepID=UPI003CF96519